MLSGAAMPARSSKRNAALVAGVALALIFVFVARIQTETGYSPVNFAPTFNYQVSLSCDLVKIGIMDLNGAMSVACSPNYA
jgi:hypothetical protein